MCKSLAAMFTLVTPDVDSMSMGSTLILYYCLATLVFGLVAAVVSISRASYRAGGVTNTTRRDWTVAISWIVICTALTAYCTSLYFSALYFGWGRTVLGWGLIATGFCWTMGLYSAKTGEEEEVVSVRCEKQALEEV